MGDRSVDPSRARATGGLPYPADEHDLLAHGTQDKLSIGDHFYSDKSPVPALFMAGIYKSFQLTTGLVAREQAHWFCYLLTVLTSGIAYVVAVCCIDRLGISLGTPTRLLLTSSFALATIALPYAERVNNHILLLALCSVLVLRLRPRTPAQLLAAGMLVGAGFTIDLGIGPVLVTTFAGLVVYRTRSFKAIALFSLGAFPLVALHHYLNYRTAGTFAPANANAAYVVWPGSAATISNMKGRWPHPSIRHFVGYALDLLFGKRGFFGHNLAL